jgi:hypothetical protein
MRSIICRISGDTFDHLKNGAMKRLAALPIEFAPSREAVRRLWRTSSEPTRQNSVAFRLQPESASSRVRPRLSSDLSPHLALSVRKVRGHDISKERLQIHFTEAFFSDVET